MKKLIALVMALALLLGLSTSALAYTDKNLEAPKAKDVVIDGDLSEWDTAKGQIITVVTGGRPYILTWCDENTNAILEAYYPGQQGGIAIAETLFGLNNPTGKTPIQFPRDMASVNNQSGDVPFDLESPLYDYGWGLSYGE